MPTVGSLFSGIGGMDLGLERAGWTVTFQVENDPYCQRVLAKHWPDVPRYGDIREVNWDDLPRVDLLAGGAPCQPVSVAGRRRGTADDRWLWPEFARVIRGLRPRLVLLENVPGLPVRGFDTILGDLATLGFDAEWSVLSACAVGAPHTRDRLFLVAYAPGHGWEQGWALAPEDVRLPGRVGDARRAPWRTEPPTDRVAHGTSGRVERLRGLGNSVVPQVAELLGRRLLEAL